MGTEIVFAVAAGVASLLSAAIASGLKDFVLRILGRQIPEKTYSERLEELTASLANSTRDVDAILQELSEVARAREKSVHKLEIDLATLESRERDLKEKIAALESAPLPVAEHFAKLVSSGENRSARRDYLLFGAGVVVSTAISILLQLLLA